MLCGNAWRKRGFTLRELLVTMTIVVVLIAILLPALGGARQTAQRAACLSNLRQLDYCFASYANDYRGHTIPANMNPGSNGQGEFWATALVPYSSKSDTRGTQGLLLNTICPTASTLSNGIGTATTAWGPTSAPMPYSPLVVGPQYGSYGLNGSLYSNNPRPPMVNTLSRPVGVIAASVNSGGNHSIFGDAIVVGNVTVFGAAQISGQLTTGGSVSGAGSIGNVVQVAAGSIQVPDVVGIYNSLAATPGLQAMASIPNNTTLNFNIHPVILVTGDADLSNVSSVTGSGTILVAGNVTSLPGSLLAMNVVTRGTVNLKNGYLDGSIYAVGDATGNGNGRINGNLVTLGAYGGTGGPDIFASSFPSFDLTYYRPGASTTINSALVNASLVPTFADCVWAEAWPAVGDPLPTASDQAKGLGRWADSNLGRFYIKRHGNAINVAFLDGHAETVQLPVLQTLKWSPQF